MPNTFQSPLSKAQMGGQSLDARVAALEQKLARLQAADVDMATASEAMQDFGVVQVGNFVSGTGTVEGGDLTGYFMQSPGALVGGVYYGIGGMSAGVLQWGGSITDGQLYAGAGAVIICANGINLAAPTGAATYPASINWLASDGSYLSDVTTYLVGGGNAYIEFLNHGGSTGLSTYNSYATFGCINLWGLGADVLLVASSVGVPARSFSNLHLALNVAEMNSNPVIYTQYTMSMTGTTVALSSTTYIGAGMTAASTVQTRTQWQTSGGILHRLFVNLRSAQPASGSLVVTVNINGTNSGLTLTIPASATAGQKRFDIAPGSASRVVVAEGDLLSVQLTNNATAASGAIDAISFDVRPI